MARDLVGRGDACRRAPPRGRARQRCSTWPSTDEATPSSRLERGAVEAREHGDRDARAAARTPTAPRPPPAAASAAARIMARPPEAWTLNMKHAEARGLPRGPRHRVRDVVELEVEEDLGRRASGRASTAAGPAAVKSWEPILKRRDEAVEALEPGARPRRGSRRRARRSGGPRRRLSEAPWYSCSDCTEISPLSSASMPPIAAWAPSTVV